MTVCGSATSDWTRKWREFCEPVTKRGNAKLKQAGNWYESMIVIWSLVRDGSRLVFHICITI